MSLSADAVRMARRRGVVGMVAGVVLIALGVAVALVGSVPALTSFGIAIVTIALLTIVVSAIALSIARHHPDVPQLGGINDFSLLLIVVCALTGALISGILDGTPTGLVIAILLAVVGYSSFTLARANRPALRREASGVAPRS